MTLCQRHTSLGGLPSIPETVSLRRLSTTGTCLSHLLIYGVRVKRKKKTKETSTKGNQFGLGFGLPFPRTTTVGVSSRMVPCSTHLFPPFLHLSVYLLQVLLTYRNINRGSEGSVEVTLQTMEKSYKVKQWKSQTMEETGGKDFKVRGRELWSIGGRYDKQEGS